MRKTAVSALEETCTSLRITFIAMVEVICHFLGTSAVKVILTTISVSW